MFAPFQSDIEWIRNHFILSLFLFSFSNWTHIGIMRDFMSSFLRTEYILTVFIFVNIFIKVNFALGINNVKRIIIRWGEWTTGFSPLLLCRRLHELLWCLNLLTLVFVKLLECKVGRFTRLLCMSWVHCCYCLFGLILVVAFLVFRGFTEIYRYIAAQLYLRFWVRFADVPL